MTRIEHVAATVLLVVASTTVAADSDSFFADVVKPIFCEKKV